MKCGQCLLRKILSLLGRYAFWAAIPGILTSLSAKIDVSRLEIPVFNWGFSAEILLDALFAAMAMGVYGLVGGLVLDIVTGGAVYRAILRWRVRRTFFREGKRRGKVDEVLRFLYLIDSFRSDQQGRRRLGTLRAFGVRIPWTLESPKGALRLAYEAGLKKWESLPPPYQYVGWEAWVL